MSKIENLRLVDCCQNVITLGKVTQILLLLINLTDTFDWFVVQLFLPSCIASPNPNYDLVIPTGYQLRLVYFIT